MKTKPDKGTESGSIGGVGAVRKGPVKTGRRAFMQQELQMQRLCGSLLGLSGELLSQC